MEYKNKKTLTEEILNNKPDYLHLTEEHILKAIDHCEKNAGENESEEDFKKSVYLILGLLYPEK